MVVLVSLNEEHKDLNAEQTKNFFLYKGQIWAASFIQSRRAKELIWKKCKTYWMKKNQNNLKQVQKNIRKASTKYGKRIFKIDAYDTIARKYRNKVKIVKI